MAVQQVDGVRGASALNMNAFLERLLLRRHRAHARLAAGVLGAVLILASCSSAGSSSDDAGEANGADTGDAMTELPAAALEIMDGGDFASARWTVLVEPVDGGTPVYSIDERVVSPMASVTKMYSVGAWLDAVGPEHRIVTPVHAVGSVADGVLDGDLVLRAMGDLVMGGRNAESGEVGYGVPPQEAANAVPGARPAPGDPLAGLDSLAQQVADSGVTSIGGEVLIDDRLFTPWTTDRPLDISPVAINDNLLAVVTSPTEEGQPGAIEVIPDTAAFTIVNDSETVAAGDETGMRLEVQRDADGNPTNTLVVSGQIAEGADERLNVYAVESPASFARTLFIEALERAGVDVAADPLAVNDASSLPTANEYTSDPPLATIESPSALAVATFIWKTSNNFGADLTVCLLAVSEGSTDCEDGFDPIRSRIDDLGIGPDEVWLFDGSGSGASSTTPRAMLTWLQWLYDRDWGDQLPPMLPILGVDGSLALSETDTASTGQVQAKTGTWALLDPSTFRLVVPVQGLAGFMNAADGTTYAFTLFMHGASFESTDGILDSSDAVARVAAAIQQEL